MTRTPELPNGRNECVFISLLCSWVLGAVMTYFFLQKGRLEKKRWKAKSFIGIGIQKMLLIYPEQHFCMTLSLILFCLRELIILSFRVFRFGSHISGIPYIIRTHFLAVLISGEVCFLAERLPVFFAQSLKLRPFKS